jgi:hypothetical protein
MRAKRISAGDASSALGTGAGGVMTLRFRAGRTVFSVLRSQTSPSNRRRYRATWRIFFQTCLRLWPNLTPGGAGPEIAKPDESVDDFGFVEGAPSDR